VYTELIDKEQCAGSEEAVRERINKLMDEWTYLTRKSSEKGEKLQEANRQRMYTAAVKDLEFWLGEVCSALSVDVQTVISTVFRSSLNVLGVADSDCTVIALVKFFLFWSL